MRQDPSVFGPFEKKIEARCKMRIKLTTEDSYKMLVLFLFFKA